MKKITILFTSLIMLFSSCSGDDSDSNTPDSLNGVWAEYRGGSERNGFSQSSAPSTIPNGINIDFVSTVGVAPSGSPLIDNGKIYMFCSDWQGYESMVAFDLNNGNEIWRYSLESSILPPAISDGILYLATSYNKVIALDANNGAEIWKTSVSIESSSPTIYNGVLLVSNVALNLMTGQVLWQYDSSINANPNSVYSSTWSDAPTATNNLVYYSGYERFANYEQNEYIFAVNINSGQEVWRQQIDNNEWGRTSIIATSNNTLYFTTNESGNHYRYALNASSGDIVWKIESDGSTSLESCPAIGYGKVFINSHHGLYAVDQNTGQEIWRFGGNGITNSSYTPTVADNKVFMLSGNFIHALDANNGSEIWKYDGVYTGGLWNMEPVILGGRIYFNDGYDISILE